jgi:gliding motility-associated-like protein
MRRLKLLFQIILCFLPALLVAQEVELFQQFNGRYDYLAFGNTLNLDENTGGTSGCVILTESSASYLLQPGQTLIAAYLYWAGVGEGDFEVSLNGNPIVAERTFNTNLSQQVFFSAFADVTAIVNASGNDTYTLSELDLTEIIPNYCTNTTNFGGWAITVIYEDSNLPLNQVNVFDGLESVSSANNELTIILDNLNVVDNVGAKIGFLAWEGDVTLAINETLQVNGTIISNPPLNPPDNAFNGTNSFTNSNVLYNMDIDFYSIENNISPGDTTATITLTSGQDFVMINNIITVLNTELPDATIEINSVSGGEECGDKDLEINYTVYNIDCTDELPTNTPISFYANAILIGQSETTVELPIDGSESGTINLTIPENVSADFILKAVIDDTGSGNGVVHEINENNNEFTLDFHLKVFPIIIGLHDLELCDVLGTEIFDLTEVTSQIDPSNNITFHLTEDDALNDVNPIATPETYENTSNPQNLWIRVSNPDCFLVDSFNIEVIPCPLPDATITIEDNLYACRQRALSISYTVFNTEATGPLPTATPIAFYISGVLIGQSHTQNVIPIGGSEPGILDVILDDLVPDIFTILAVVDDVGTGIGIIFELNDFNNTFEITVEFGIIPPIVPLPNLLGCNEGNNMTIFDLTENEDLISDNPNEISYFTSFDNAIENTAPISDPEHFQNTSDPQTIYVRLENEICFTTASFLLTTENCPPIIYQGMSPNDDGSNDTFIIERLLDVYENFELQIYSREGNLIYKSGNEDGLWTGIPNTGLLYTETLVPVGTYFYVLHLNDAQYPDPFTGFVYVNY